MAAVKRRRAQAGVSLIELLVGMIIMSIITTMILITWFALQGSFSYSVASNVQREDARVALSRMQREIRDAESLPGVSTSQPALYRAHAYWIAFFTTFNKVGNTSADTEPRLVAYRLYSDGSLWRFQDTGGDGYISGVAGLRSLNDPAPSTDDPSGYSLTEQTNGEGAQKVVGSAVNFTRSGGPLAILNYLYYDSSGAHTAAIVSDGTARANTRAVTTRLLVDLNPGHSPIYADLAVTSQLRNQR